MADQDPSTIIPITPPAAPNPAAPAAPTPPAPQAQAEPGKLEALPPEWQAYIRELRDNDAKSRIRAKQAEEAATARENERLAQAGQWQTIAQQAQQKLTELAPKAELAEQYEQSVRESNAKRLAQVPDNYKPLVPTFAPPLQLSQWFDANAALLGPRQAPNLNAGAGSQTPSAVTLTPEELAYAAKMGISPENYAKGKKG